MHALQSKPFSLIFDLTVWWTRVSRRVVSRALNSWGGVRGKRPSSCPAFARHLAPGERSREHPRLLLLLPTAATALCPRLLSAVSAACAPSWSENIKWKIAEINNFCFKLCAILGRRKKSRAILLDPMCWFWERGEEALCPSLISFGLSSLPRLRTHSQGWM